MGQQGNNTTTPNVFGQAAQGMQQAGNIASTAGTNVNMNPYTQGVIDRLQQDTLQQQQMASNDLGAAATRAGAFGGDRHGIAEGQMRADINNNFMTQAANLRNNAWQQGVDNQFRQASALSGLAGQGFGMGLDLTNLQRSMSAEQRAIQQQVLDNARNQYLGWTGSPVQGLNMMTSVLGQTPYGQTTTQSQSPGLLGILGAGLSFL